jgi:hypothetical protein
VVGVAVPVIVPATSQDEPAPPNAGKRGKGKPLGKFPTYRGDLAHAKA